MVTVPPFLPCFRSLSFPGRCSGGLAVLALLERPAVDGSVAVSSRDITAPPAEAAPARDGQQAIWGLLKVLEKPVSELRG